MKINNKKSIENWLNFPKASKKFQFPNACANARVLGIMVPPIPFFFKDPPENEN